MMLNKLFSKEYSEREDGYIQVAKLTELGHGKLKRVVVKGQPIILTLIEAPVEPRVFDVTAFSAICPHALGDLSQGWLTTDEVDCPVHYYRFSTRSGVCTYPKGGPKLRIYPVHVEGNAVMIKIEKPKWMDQTEE